MLRRDEHGLAEVERLEAPASPIRLVLLPSRAGDRAAARFVVVGEHSSHRYEYSVELPARDAEVRSKAEGRAAPMAKLTLVSRSASLVGEHAPAIATSLESRMRLSIGPRVEPCRAVVDVLSHAVALTCESSAARIVHDGPIWAAAPIASARGDVLLVTFGVEDHPLDRRGGFFGHIDSFAYLYRISVGSEPQRIDALNLSEHGVVTPKCALSEGPRVFVAGYGSERGAELALDGDRLRLVRSFAAPPGTADLAMLGDRLVAANTLLDAWVPLDAADAPLFALDESPGAQVMGHDAALGPGHAARLEPEIAEDIEPDIEAERRLGEALAFTTLIAPDNSSEEAHSRFTCETCHFEGAIDGRRHHTGRGDVFATTKPLFGLFNNRPHFTRALDPDLTKIAHAEVRVAGAGSGKDPWFSLRTSEHPWLELLFGDATHKGSTQLARLAPNGTLEPELQRRALMRFFMAFSHRPNPRVMVRLERGEGSFTPEERRGAAVFERRCESCHSARLSTDAAASRVPFDRWERLVLDPRGPIVWARDGYEQTGIVPYVHANGARPSSLRRIADKRPYFTNGSATSLEQLVSRARQDGERFFHGSAPETAEAIPDYEAAALVAFLRLL